MRMVNATAIAAARPSMTTETALTLLSSESSSIKMDESREGFLLAAAFGAVEIGFGAGVGAFAAAGLGAGTATGLEGGLTGAAAVFSGLVGATGGVGGVLASGVS